MLKVLNIFLSNTKLVEFDFNVHLINYFLMFSTLYLVGLLLFILYKSSKKKKF